MRKLLVLIFILIGTIFLIKPVNAISKLHVDGRYIKNEANHTVFLRGVNKAEMVDDPDGIWMGSTIWTDANVKTELDAMESWGINVVRIHFSVELWKYDIGPDSGHPASPYCGISTREAIKKLLNFTAERGMYVILDAYSVRCYWTKGDQDPLPFPPYQTSENASEIIGSVDDFVDFWRSVASELKDYPNVIFEIWNEPHNTASANKTDEEAFMDWMNAWNLCADAIREVGATQPIIFQWGMGVYCNLYENDETGEVYAKGGGHLHHWMENAIGNLTDPLDNIIYSTHVYRLYGGTGLYQGSAKDKYGYRGWPYEHVKAAFEYMGFKWVGDTLNKPLFIGEVGCDIAFTDEEYVREIAAWNNTLNIFNEWGISYAAFWWRNIGVFRLLKYGEPWVPPPTESGQILIDNINPLIFGVLKDKNNNPIQANITIYEKGTEKIINENRTNSSGYYELRVKAGVYDVKFDIPSIPNFSIKLLAVNVFSKLQDIINYITSFDSNRISFTLDVKGNRTIQIESRRPIRILLNGSEMPSVSSFSELKNTSWYYEDSTEKLYLKIGSDLKMNCIYECCKNETHYYDKPCSSDYYCEDRMCKPKTECPFECCVNEEKYLDKSCPKETYCSNRACLSIYAFKDDFESGNLNKWNVTAESGCFANVVNETKHNGSYSAKLHLQGSDKWVRAEKINLGPFVKSFSRVYVRFNSTPPLNKRWAILSLRTTLYHPLLWLWNEDGRLKWVLDYKTDGANRYYLNASEPTPQADTWYSVEIKWYSRNGEIRIYIDGIERANATNLDIDSSKLNGIWIEGYSYTDNPNVDIYFDDVAISNITYIGP